MTQTARRSWVPIETSDTDQLEIAMVRRLERDQAGTEVSAVSEHRDHEQMRSKSTVTTFVPTQTALADVSHVKSAFCVRKVLIDMTPDNDPRIRNAWVRGSNPLCAPKNNKIKHIRRTRISARISL
jgi:hypothetical protein